MRGLPVLVACLVAVGAGAHGGGDRWRPEPTRVPDGVVVQVHSSPLGHQLLVENRTAKRLEVRDARGRPFLRIGPEGVSADLNTAAWHRSQNAGDRPLPETARDPQAPARWARIQAEPHWGWFDPRLERTEHADRWRIPATLAGRPAPIAGRFEALRPLEPLHQPALRGADALPNAVQARVIPDSAAPALMLSYGGEAPLVVLDREGAPMLRFSPAGVEANAASRGWRRLGRAPRESGGWVRVSETPRYAWPDARLVRGDDATAEWRIPLRQGGRPLPGLRGGWSLREANPAP